jgi:hypothetical protein
VIVVLMQRTRDRATFTESTNGVDHARLVLGECVQHGCDEHIARQTPNQI